MPVERLDDGSVDFEVGLYLAERGPSDWWERFPLAAGYVESVNQGHRVWHIAPDVREEFMEISLGAAGRLR